jgi:RNA polymerase sigma-70 factor, ECF subfamily
MQTATASGWVHNEESTAELDLVRRLRMNDHSAFRELVERHQAQVYSTVLGILRNPEDADDVAQQVFIKVYRSMARFDSRGSLYGWIYRIAVNESLDSLRKRRVRLAYEGAPPEHETAATPQRPIDRRLADRDFLTKLLANIPEQDRLLLMLKEIEGRSINELSTMTGLKEGTIKIRLFRARRRLVEAAREPSAPLQQVAM